MEAVYECIVTTGSEIYEVKRSKVSSAQAIDGTYYWYIDGADDYLDSGDIEDMKIKRGTL